jgi:hypothetical protein
MFGLGTKKVLDDQLLLQNLSEMIVRTWTDKSTLDFEKFADESSFRVEVALDQKAIEKFMGEKLRLILGFVFVTLEKSGKADLKQKLYSILLPQLEELNNNDLVRQAKFELSDKAENYSRAIISKPPKESGEYIEMIFARRVYNKKPEELDTNAKYTLYKQLSQLQRTTILSGSVAIRKSYVKSK